VPEVLDERVTAVQPDEDGPGIGAQGQFVGQVGAETLQDADAQQEVLESPPAAA
jgi:hypothetical protein